MLPPCWSSVSKFSAVMVFAAIWLTIVYFPIAHMVWAGGGLFFEMGALGK